MRGTSRLLADLKALKCLVAQLKPPLLVQRSSRIISVFYGFVDVSGTGLGASFLTQRGISGQMGVWSADTIREQTGNWK